MCLIEAAQVAAFFFALRDRAAERREWAKERERLLDRVMAPDYYALKAYEPRPETPERPLTEEERKRAAEDVRIADEAHGLV